MITTKQVKVLDLEFWIGYNGNILHTFYEKEVSCPYTILQRSAVSSSMKRTTNFAEGMRRLKNIHPEVERHEIPNILSKYMNKLKISDYNEKYRLNLLKGLLKRKDQLEQMITRKEITRYRNRQELLATKKSMMGKYNNTWFLRDNINTTMTVPATPGSQLATMVSRNLSGEE